MILRNFTRGLMIPVILTGLSAPAAATPYGFSGTVAAVCKLGSSTTYAISIDFQKNDHLTISLDGTAGNVQKTNNQFSTITKSYQPICNSSGNTTLHLTAPATVTSAIPYTITVKNGAGTTVATATSPATNINVVVPPSTSASTAWSISAQAMYNQGGNINTGTYTATVTIQ